MPKVKKSGIENAQHLYNAKVAYYRRLYDVASEDLAIHARCHVTTLYRHLQDPRRMTVFEFLRVAQKLHFTPEDWAQITQEAMQP